jgi:hypothetical protein
LTSAAAIGYGSDLFGRKVIDMRIQQISAYRNIEPNGWWWQALRMEYACGARSA